MKTQHFLASSWEKRPSSNLDGLGKVRGFTGGCQILVESIKSLTASGEEEKNPPLHPKKAKTPPPTR